MVLGTLGNLLEAEAARMEKARPLLGAPKQFMNAHDAALLITDKKADRQKKNADKFVPLGTDDAQLLLINLCR